MLDQLKSHLEKSGEFLDRIVDQVEDEAEDFADDSRELWKLSKQHVRQLKARLSEASTQLDTASDEARLQAHLAAMDAHEQWQTLQHNVHAFMRYANDKSRPVLDHAVLQSHLAHMDARDFMKESGQAIKEDFHLSKEKVEQASMKAAADIREHCEGLIAGLPK